MRLTGGRAEGATYRKRRGRFNRKNASGARGRGRPAAPKPRGRFGFRAAAPGYPPGCPGVGDRGREDRRRGRLRVERLPRVPGNAAPRRPSDHAEREREPDAGAEPDFRRAGFPPSRGPPSRRSGRAAGWRRGPRRRRRGCRGRRRTPIASWLRGNRCEGRTPIAARIAGSRRRRRCSPAAGPAPAAGDRRRAATASTAGAAHPATPSRKSSRRPAAAPTRRRLRDRGRDARDAGGAGGGAFPPFPVGHSPGRHGPSRASRGLAGGPTAIRPPTVTASAPASGSGRNRATPPERGRRPERAVGPGRRPPARRRGDLGRGAGDRPGGARPRRSPEPGRDRA